MCYGPAGVSDQGVPCYQHGICSRGGPVCLHTWPQLLWQAGRGAGALDLPATHPGLRLLPPQGELLTVLFGLPMLILAFTAKLHGWPAGTYKLLRLMSFPACLSLAVHLCYFMLCLPARSNFWRAYRTLPIPPCLAFVDVKLEQRLVPTC